MHPDQHIALLAARLPRQRRCLVTQSAAVGQAVSRAVSSPTALAAAALGGAVLGWYLYRQPGSSNNGSVASRVPPAEAWRARLWVFIMACLARSLV
mgnify:FL=1